MLNERKQDRPGNSRFFKCPTTVKSGDPVLIGTMAGVALDNYNAALGGCVFRLSGTFALTVVAASQRSPVANVAIKPGDELYASGTYDATTNCTTGLTIDKTLGNIPFGNYDERGDGQTAGTTVTSAWVKLKEGGSWHYAP